MRLLLVVFFLSSCSGFHSIPSQDAQLLPYFNDYYSECTVLKSVSSCQDIFQIDLEFAVLNSPVEGVCQKWSEQTTFDNYVYRRIAIDPNTWSQLSETARHALIYHELGHCHLNRGHLDTNGGPGLPSYVPSSIMNERRFQDSFLEYYHVQYMHELFSGY